MLQADWVVRLTHFRHAHCAPPLRTLSMRMAVTGVSYWPGPGSAALRSTSTSRADLTVVPVHFPPEGGCGPRSS